MMSPKSGSMGSDLKLFILFGWDQSSFVCCLGHRGLPDFGVRVSVTFHLTCVHVILVRFGLLSGTVWEIAADSIGHMLSLYFDYL